MTSNFTRSFPLEDIRIRSGGDGRTVEAYAAVFDIDVPINDRDGQYNERIAPGAFDYTIRKRGTNFGVLYNHGMTIYGTPSDRGSMPIGTPLEVRADSRGLFTVTRYNQTPLAEEVLEGIKSESLRAQSFQGMFVKSDKRAPRGGFRAAADGSLVTVTRQEINLKEYGPTPFPAYEDAVITGVRASLAFSPAEKAVLATLLANLAEGDAIVDQVVMQALQILGLDSALDCAQSYLSGLLAVPNPDAPDILDEIGEPDRAAALQRLTAIATRLRAVSADGTSATRPGRLGSGDSGTPARSARLSLSKRSRQILAALH